MTDVTAAVAAGIAERLCTRIRAQDRLDALEEDAGGSTLLERISSDGATLRELAADALGELLQCLADARDRESLRAVRDGARTDVATSLMRNGMVTSSWDGSSVAMSPLGDSSLQLFDQLTADVAARVRERLQVGDEG